MSIETTLYNLFSLIYNCNELKVYFPTLDNSAEFSACKASVIRGSERIEFDSIYSIFDEFAFYDLECQDIEKGVYIVTAFAR